MPTPQQLTAYGIKTLDPEFSPDGQRIVYVGERGDGEEVEQGKDPTRPEAEPAPEDGKGKD